MPACYHRIQGITAFALAALCVSCSPGAQKGKYHKSYYDLKEYFQNQAFHLDSLKPFAEKTIEKDGVTERKTLQIADWSKELDVFIRADINRPAWRDGYTTDTAFVEGKKTVSYLARSELMPVKQIVLTFASGTNFKPGEKCTRINIRSSQKNILYSSTQELTYYPDSGYHIKGEQHILAFNMNYDIGLRVVFAPNSKIRNKNILLNRFILLFLPH